MGSESARKGSTVQKAKHYFIAGALVLSLFLAACSKGEEQQTESSVEVEPSEVTETTEETTKEVVTSLYDGRITRAAEGFDQKIVQLREQNADTIGWISIDGTENEYPLMQTEDNEFYLLHDFDKEDLPLGMPYLDASNSPWMTDQNSVIYGHMPYGERTMKFGVLRYYKDQDYVDDAAKTVTITTNSGIYVYRLFSLHTVSAYAPYRYANVPEDEYVQFLQETKDASEVDFHFDRELTAKDRIVTLSTCTTEHDDDYRIAVVGVLEKAQLSPEAFATAEEFYASFDQENSPVQAEAK